MAVNTKKRTNETSMAETIRFTTFTAVRQVMIIQFTNAKTGNGNAKARTKSTKNAIWSNSCVTVRSKFFAKK